MIPEVKYAPVDDRLFVLRDSPEKVTEAGIVIPDTSQKVPTSGRVVAAGPGRMTDAGNRIPLAITRGDHVIFSSFAGTEIEIDGVKFLILHEHDVLGFRRA